MDQRQREELEMWDVHIRDPISRRDGVDGCGIPGDGIVVREHIVGRDVQVDPRFESAWVDFAGHRLVADLAIADKGENFEVMFIKKLQSF